VSFLFGNVNVLKKQQRNVDVQTNQKGIPKAVPGKEGTFFGMMRNETRLKPFHQ